MKRRLLKLGLLILAGAIVSVVVACGFLQANGGPSGSRAPVAKTANRRPLTLPEERWSNEHVIQKILQMAPDSRRGTPVAEVDRGIGWRRTVIIEEYFGPGGRDVFVQGIQGPGKTTGRITVGMLNRIECGWPSRSIVIDVNRSTPTLPSYADCRPLWPGFAINAIFYAAILWLLFAAPGSVRRRRRIKRGLCPACAYPVGENATCTECGKPVPTKCVAPT
ncbi:MAG: hypothetical protein L0219_10795 [Phycisphaerales bacterium]|nr:hypothetical protein [Phycisphaerales bacterium]